MARDFTVSVKGLQESKDRLRQILKNVQATGPRVEELGRVIEADAISRVPKYSGALQSTIKVQFRKQKNGVYYLKAVAGGSVKGVYMVKQVNYAVDQHETQYSNYTTAGTGPGYIKIPFDYYTDRFIKSLGKEIGKK